MPIFDKSKRYSNKKGQKFGKGVWIREDGTVLTPGWGEMNRGAKTVTQYNTDGTTTVIPWTEWTKKKELDHELRVIQNDRKWAIPLVKSKMMSISIDKNEHRRDGSVCVLRLCTWIWPQKSWRKDRI